MPSPLTIKKYIAKTKSKLAKQRKKMEHSKADHNKIKAKLEIGRLESKLLYFEQSLILEQAKIDVQRDKKIRATKQVHASQQDGQGCDQVGAGADTTIDGGCPW